MDSALGPPDAMAEKRDELTPMMAQYHDLCARYDDAIVLFQVGDFYETFCGAAERTARLLEIALTSREDSTGEYPMAGIPIDNAESYIEELLEAGYRVAVADQVEEPGETSGVVERAVTRVITPGTLTEDELLAGDDNNFVAAIARDDERLGLALLDVSTGDFYATSATATESIADEVSRFDPSEAVVGPDAPADPVPDDCMVTPFDARAFDRERAGETLSAYFRNPDALLAGDAERRACGALLAYAEYVRGGEHEANAATPTRNASRPSSRATRTHTSSTSRNSPATILASTCCWTPSPSAARTVRTADRPRTGRRHARRRPRRDRERARRPHAQELAPPAAARSRPDRARHDAVAELKSAVQRRERLHDRLRESTTSSG